MSGAAPSFWGDESAAVDGVLAWAGSRAHRPGDPKTSARPASELAAAAGQTITAAGIGWQAALDVFGRVFAPATRAQDDPMNLAFIPSAPTRSAVAFDLATSAANIFGGTWEAGAGAIAAENQALAWLVSLLGWPPDAGGCFVPGGTMGNLSALTAAREQQRRSVGGRPDAGWQLACSAAAHSSISAAARVLDADVIIIPTEDDRLTAAALAAGLPEGPAPFAVVASAGTTNAGIVDDLAGVAEVCSERGIWLHVDGAYGGAGLAAPSARHRFAGIESADSFIVDPHKCLFAPFDCCALLYRHPEAARAAHAQTAEYLDTIDREAWNPADLAIHLSRRARGLPFWFSLAAFGTDRYRDAIEQTLATAQEVAEGIEAMSHLTLVRPPELSVLLFERPGWQPEQYRAWSQRASGDGEILCLPTSHHGRTVLRLAFVNPDTRAGDVLAVLEGLR
jgi:glutamate/tyrosine decarboxylase-like PLP-dependent enzyme